MAPQDVNAQLELVARRGRRTLTLAWAALGTGVAGVLLATFVFDPLWNRFADGTFWSTFWDVTSTGTGFTGLALILIGVCSIPLLQLRAHGVRRALSSSANHLTLLTALADAGGRHASVVPLRHYRLFSRCPYILIDGEALALRLPTFFPRTWRIPLQQVAVVREGAPTCPPQGSRGGDVFVEPIRIPYLATTTTNVPPNLMLLFAIPMRIPSVRLMASFNGGVPYRASRSAPGYLVDGLELRAKDPDEAVETLLAAGVPGTTSAEQWLGERRITSRDPQSVEQVRRRILVTRRAQRIGLLGLPMLLVARFLNDTSRAPTALSLILAAAGLALVFAVPAVASRARRREDTDRSGHS